MNLCEGLLLIEGTPYKINWVHIYTTYVYCLHYIFLKNNTILNNLGCLSDLDNLRALALEIDKSYWSSLSFVNLFDLLDVQLFSFFVFSRSQIFPFFSFISASFQSLYFQYFYFFIYFFKVKWRIYNTLLTHIIFRIIPTICMICIMLDNGHTSLNWCKSFYHWL